MPTESCVKRKIFTLIELLVVIAIISVLMTMLLPALKKTKEKTQQINCLSIEKQLGQTVHMYSIDNEGWLPSCSYTNIMTNGARWNYAISPYAEDLFSWAGKGCLDYNGGTYPTCPSAKPPAKDSWDPVAGAWGLTDYGYNGYFGYEYSGGAYDIQKISKVKKTSKTVSFIDNDTTSYRALPANHASTKMSSRHSMGTNLAFFDGHASWYKYPIIMVIGGPGPYWWADGTR